MRAFIAVELDEKIRENCRRIMNRLMTSDADVKWVKPSNMHLTLKFLGEIDEPQAEEIKEFIREIASEKYFFETGFSGLGFFPNQRKPRVLWLGINKGIEVLKDLADKIDDKSAVIGIEKEERAFSPHLTLGRFRSLKNFDELMKIVEKNREFDAGTMQVEGIHLIQSVLQPAGPVYTKIYTAILKNNPL